MTKEDEAPKCKLRFKGVENFLRRVAFNLGNTPSQTEVKIISCIPIDVTDLQQKIVQLERQLEDSRNAKEDTKDDVERNGKETSADDTQKPANGVLKPPNGSSKRESTVHTAICTNTLPRFSKPRVRTDKFDCNISNNSELFDDKSSKRRKSAVSFIFSATPSINVKNSSSQSKKSKLINGGNCSAVTKEIYRNVFKKKKRFPKKKNNSQLVYYTETDGCTPFHSQGITHTNKDITHDESDLITRSYLSNMIRKQYDSMQVLDELSNTSYFTSPICKDAEEKFHRLYEIDMCSCCHGTFQNIDDYLSKTRFNAYPALTLNDNRNTYYDSSLYDLIPVKEKPVKNKMEFNSPKRKEHKIDIDCWPEEVRIRSRPQPFIVNYHTTTIPDKNIYRKKVLTKFNNRRDNNTAVSLKPTKHSVKLNQQIGMEASKSCLVNFENLNTKPSRKLKNIKLSEKPKPLVKNVECLTTTINHSECQTSTLNPITSAPENKTEATLNQIKCILQSVLTEVKTGTQVKHTEIETKKDAIVQNEISENNMHDKSSLLNSFTYSPYNINPYGPSCSKQMPSNNFCYPNLPHPINCMQNYPLIIQGTGRHLCTGCFRSSQIKTNKNTAITASTNTEQFRVYRNKETEKLIQEIYKSVALGIPTKDPPLSEHDDVKSVKEPTCYSSKHNKQVKVVISELFTNRNVQMDTSRTNDTNITKDSKILKTDSAQSRLTTTDTGTDNQVTNENTKTFFTDKTVPQTTETEPETEKEVKPHRTEPKRKTPSTVSESSESEDPSDTESAETIVSAKGTQVKKKAGLFCKMFQIFNKNKKTCNIKKKSEPEEPETSDSDDYQTIYSHKSEIPKHDKSINIKSRTHSKILQSRRAHHRQRSPEKPRRTPYMEQEYKRLWTEKLMLHNQRQRCSSEKPFSKESSPKARHRQPHYHNYEARSVLVDSGRLYRPQFTNQNKNSLYTTALDDVVHRNRFGQQLNTIPYSSYNGKCITQENTRPTVPISAFYRKGYQNTSPTFIKARQEQIKEPKSLRDTSPVNPTKPKGLSWFAKHKNGLRCGEQWKQLLLES